MTHGFIFNFSKSTICYFVFKWMKLNCRSLVFFCKAWTFQKYKKKWKANNWKKSTFHLFINILFYLISKITSDLKNFSKRFRKRNISCFFLPLLRETLWEVYLFKDMSFKTGKILMWCSRSTKYERDFLLGKRLLDITIIIPKPLCCKLWNYQSTTTCINQLKFGCTFP